MDIDIGVWTYDIDMGDIGAWTVGDIGHRQRRHRCMDCRRHRCMDIGDIDKGDIGAWT